MLTYLDTDLLIKKYDLYAQTKYQLIVDKLPQQRLDILVVGCGTGELATLLASHNHHVVGIDPNKRYITKARQLAKRDHLQNCTFIQSSIEKFSSSSRFDVVIATDVLEHITDDQKAIIKMSQLCRKQLLITVPALFWLFGYHDLSLGHFRRYSKNILQHLGKKAGGRVYIRYFGITLIPIAFVFSKILHRPYPIVQFGKPKKPFWRFYLLSLLLHIEKKISPPFGTSLLMEVRKD
jgi:SAM-dependent methyltransferase